MGKGGRSGFGQRRGCCLGIWLPWVPIGIPAEPLDEKVDKQPDPGRQQRPVWKECVDAKGTEVEVRKERDKVATGQGATA